MLPTELASLEWAQVIKLALIILTMIGAMVGLIFFVVKWMLGKLATDGQKLADDDKILFAKFNEGGQVYKLELRVQKLEQVVLMTNVDNTIVQRALIGNNK